MQMQDERTAIESLLARYAEALNTANTAAISSFYTADGVFMPDHFKALTAAALSERRGAYLQKAHFHIAYSIQHILAGDYYAFIEATATTTATDPITHKKTIRGSQDFFVLRKDKAAWKIFRYIFNNVKTIEQQ
ncbi:MAG TPA: nuclear transport factor 2 family protein [Chitinophaga sp.]